MYVSFVLLLYDFYIGYLVGGNVREIAVKQNSQRAMPTKKRAVWMDKNT